MNYRTFACSIGACLLFPLGVLGQDVPRPTNEQLQVLKSADYSRYPQQNFPNQVFFGETHLHSSYSTDAGMIGNTLGPDDAFRIARGLPFVSSMGVPGRLSRPFDFVVVTDHSENLGLAPAIATSDPDLLANPWGRKMHDLVKAGKPMEAFDMFVAQIFVGEDKLKGSPLPKTYWDLATTAAEANNFPGAFTAFIGYEWSSAPGGQTYTETSSIETERIWRIRSFHSHHMTPLILKISGTIWNLTRKLPVAKCWQLPTMGTCPMA